MKQRNLRKSSLAVRKRCTDAQVTKVSGWLSRGHQPAVFFCRFCELSASLNCQTVERDVSLYMPFVRAYGGPKRFTGVHAKKGEFFVLPSGKLGHAVSRSL